MLVPSELTDADLGREVEYRATHDPDRAPERGLLAGWDGEGIALVRFWSDRLGAYRARPFGVLASGVRFADEPAAVSA